MTFGAFSKKVNSLLESQHGAVFARPTMQVKTQSRRAVVIGGERTFYYYFFFWLEGVSGQPGNHANYALAITPQKIFRVHTRARNSSHLVFLETVFISGMSPVLCSQKERVCAKLRLTGILVLGQPTSS